MLKRKETRRISTENTFLGEKVPFSDLRAKNDPKWPKMAKNGCFFGTEWYHTVSERFWSQFLRYEVHIVLN